jgi:hypothetical protein
LKPSGKKKTEGEIESEDDEGEEEDEDDELPEEEIIPEDLLLPDPAPVGAEELEKKSSSLSSSATGGLSGRKVQEIIFPSFLSTNSTTTTATAPAVLEDSFGKDCNSILEPITIHHLLQLKKTSISSTEHSFRIFEK